MTDRQILLRDRICDLVIREIDGDDLTTIVNAAAACMGAAACVIGLLREDHRSALVPMLVDALPEHVEKRAQEIKSGSFDRRFRGLLQ